LVAAKGISLPYSAARKGYVGCRTI